MYNYMEDKNLNEVYNYLKANNMYEAFIKNIVLETEEYKIMLKNAKVLDNIKENSKKSTKKDAVERNEK